MQMNCDDCKFPLAARIEFKCETCDKNVCFECFNKNHKHDLERVLQKYSPHSPKQMDLQIRLMKKDFLSGLRR